MSVMTPTSDQAGQANHLSQNTQQQDLTVGDIMSHETITVDTNDTVFSAALKMTENNISCVVVIDNEMVIGILTDKDVLKGVAGNDREFHHLRVTDRMSSPVEMVSPETSIFTASQIIESKGIKQLPVTDNGCLQGVVTQTDIARGLVAISPLKAVSDIMSTDVATIETGATIADSARLMSSRGISSLIAIHRHGIAGIITEKDLLRRVVALHKDPDQMQVVDVMSFPLISIPPSYSILSAAKKMDTLRLHRLVVMDDDQIHGIVTQTDITRAIRAEFERIRQEQRASAAKLETLIQSTMDDLERLQMFLNETRYPIARSMGNNWSPSHLPAIM